MYEGINISGSEKASLGWKDMAESIVRWFIVREKYCWMTSRFDI